MSDMVQCLADKAELADLVHTYALNIRSRQPKLNARLFTSDASFEVREADPMRPESLKVTRRAEGVAEVMASITGATTTHRVFPAIHNLIVTLHGDRASATSLMISTVFPGLGETLGEYEDHFRREGGSWRFSARTYTIYREG
ncbi:MAG: nuclear transport factor 2 family protein [Novosphingobium sp.]